MELLAGDMVEEVGVVGGIVKLILAKRPFCPIRLLQILLCFYIQLR